MDNQTAVVVNGEAIGLRDLLRGMKARHGAQFLEEAVQDALVRQAARERGITVPDAELQKAADDYRRSAGLFDVGATDEWLKRSGLTVEDFEQRLEAHLLAQRLRDAVAGEQVDQFFASNRGNLDRAIVAQVVVSERQLADELLAQVAEEGADFAAVAGEHSLDPMTRTRGGFVGPVSRESLGADGESLVFGASPGQVVGPVKSQGGWMVLKVYAVTPAQLDDGTRDEIKNALFQQWLQEQRAKATVETPLLSAV